MKKLVPVVAIAALALSFSAPLTAQEAVVAQVQIVDPLPGHDADFLEAVGNQFEMYTSSGGAWPWASFRVAMGPRTGQYVFYTGPHSYADFDAPDGDQERMQENMDEEILPHVESAVISMMRVRDDLSIMDPDATIQPIYEVITMWSAGPAMDDQLVHVLAKIKESMEALGAPIQYTVFQGAQGADPGQWVVSIPHASFAAMDGGVQSMEAMFAGAAGQFESGALVEMFHEAVADATNEVFVLMPNLTANLPN